MNNTFIGKFSWKLAAVVLIIWIASFAPSVTPALALNTSYYVDCSAVSNGTGTQASPWNNLATVNAHAPFGAGDSILFRRGTTCVGQLWPKGSGVSGNPVTVSAYDIGARPIINGNNAVAPVVTIKDQNYWVIDSLEIKNSTGLGLYVNGTVGVDLYGFTLTNLYVHHGGMNDGQQLVQVGQYQSHSVHDVLIDNVEASNGWRGIEIGGKCCNNSPARSTNVTIRNANIHNVQSDGILTASTNDAVTETSVVYETGLMTSLQNHTPNGLWTWDCGNCMVQLNEVYTSHSPSWDGGAFDIDYFTDNNTVQYNYAHDNDAYCVAVFGGDNGDVTTTNVVRYNICANDARDGTLADNRNGAIYMAVWSGGSVQDTHIYNNTVYYNPAGTHSAINIVKLGGGTSTINNTNIYNNIIYSTSAKLVKIASYTAQTHMDNNLYWYTGAGSPSFVWGTTTYTSFSAWKTGSAQDANSLYVNPLLNDPTYHGIGKPVSSFTLQSGSPAINAGANLVALGKVASMGSRDFFGNAIPNGAYDIGAYEFGGAPPPTATPTNTNTPAPPTSTPTAGPSPTPTNTPLPPTSTPTGCNGTTNIALNKTVVFTTSVQSGEIGQHAVDGSTSTRWWTLKNSTLPDEYIVVDLGSSMTFCKAMLYQGDRYATAWNIQVSPDNINWTTAFSTTSFVSNGWQTVSFSNATGRYVKYDTTAWFNPNDRAKTFEFQLYQP